jgi:hypothetical protein
MIKKTKITPVFPLAGDVTTWRRKVKRMISTANPTTVQAILVLLLELDKQIKIRELYKDNRCR